MQQTSEVYNPVQFEGDFVTVACSETTGHSLFSASLQEGKIHVLLSSPSKIAMRSLAGHNYYSTVSLRLTFIVKEQKQNIASMLKNEQDHK